MTDLERLHECLLKILDEIDRLCRKHDIPYFLDSGTTLGAVRHKGFIPWDDDADVGFLRENFERFVEVAKTELAPEFFLQTVETDPGYYNFNAKIRINNTYYPEKINQDKNMHKGISVDVFPFDYVSDKQDEANREIKKSRRLNGIYLFANNNVSSEALPKHLLRQMLRKIKNEKYYNIFLKHCKKHSKKPTQRVTCFSYRMSSDNILCFNIEDIKNTCDATFEGRTYKIMSGYDNYLKVMYGDYMELPPEDKRIVHISDNIIFDTEREEK